MENNHIGRRWNFLHKYTLACTCTLFYSVRIVYTISTPNTRQQLRQHSICIEETTRVRLRIASSAYARAFSTRGPFAANFNLRSSSFSHPLDTHVICGERTLFTLSSIFNALALKLMFYANFSAKRYNILHTLMQVF